MSNAHSRMAELGSLKTTREFDDAQKLLTVAEVHLKTVSCGSSRPTAAPPRVGRTSDRLLREFAIRIGSAVAAFTTFATEPQSTADSRHAGESRRALRAFETLRFLNRRSGMRGMPWRFACDGRWICVVSGRCRFVYVRFQSDRFRSATLSLYLAPRDASLRTLPG